MRHTEPHDNGYNRVGFIIWTPRYFQWVRYPQLLLNMQQRNAIMGPYDSKYRNKLESIKQFLKRERDKIIPLC